MSTLCVKNVTNKHTSTYESYSIMPNPNTRLPLFHSLPGMQEYVRKNVVVKYMTLLRRMNFNEILYFFGRLCSNVAQPEEKEVSFSISVECFHFKKSQISNNLSLYIWPTRTRPNRWSLVLYVVPVRSSGKQKLSTRQK